jgi:hypothetical protein
MLCGLMPEPGSGFAKSQWQIAGRPTNGFRLLALRPLYLLRFAAITCSRRAVKSYTIALEVVVPVRRAFVPVD